MALLSPHHRTAAGFHPYFVVLVACMAPLYLGGFLSDVGYARTYEIQWINFAAWLVAGAMVFNGLALAWSLLEAALQRGRRRQGLILAGLLLVMFLVGLINNLIHARDAWATMPGGLIWSTLLALMSIAAVWLSVSALRRGETA